MALNEKERSQFKEWIHKESPYKDKRGKFEKQITIGDIARDSGHSNRREVIDISNEITREK